MLRVVYNKMHHASEPITSRLCRNYRINHCISFNINIGGSSGGAPARGPLLNKMFIISCNFWENLGPPLIKKTCLLSVAAQCDGLHSPSNGQVSFNRGQLNGQYPVGTRATFVCNSYYLINNENLRICQSNGQWSSSQVSCIGKWSHYSIPASFTLS